MTLCFIYVKVKVFAYKVDFQKNKFNSIARNNDSTLW